MELVPNTIDGDATRNRAFHPVVNEIAFCADGGVVVVVAQLHGFAIDSQVVQCLPGINESIIHVFRVSRIVVRIGGDRVPLGATEAIRLALINCFVHHIPNVNVSFVVTD